MVPTNENLSIFSPLKELYDQAMFPESEYKAFVEIYKCREKCSSDELRDILGENIDRIQWINRTTALVKFEAPESTDKALYVNTNNFNVRKICNASEKTKLAAIKLVEADWTVDGEMRKRPSLDLGPMKRILNSSMRN